SCRPQPSALQICLALWLALDLGASGVFPSTSSSPPLQPSLREQGPPPNPRRSQTGGQTDRLDFGSEYSHSHHEQSEWVTGQGGDHAIYPELCLANASRRHPKSAHACMQPPPQSVSQDRCSCFCIRPYRFLRVQSSHPFPLDFDPQTHPTAALPFDGCHFQSVAHYSSVPRGLDWGLSAESTQQQKKTCGPGSVALFAMPAPRTGSMYVEQKVVFRKQDLERGGGVKRQTPMLAISRSHRGEGGGGGVS
ncbi:hypothetical protein LY76DRAFT_657113, partial [Colletotrichum caudatum]